MQKIFEICYVEDSSESRMKFETRESITFMSEGCKMFGILHLPLEVEKAPVVVICHGFGGEKTGKFRIYVDESELLVKQGIASLRFDFRGCGDSEGSWLDMTIGNEVTDTLNALKFLETVPQVDLSRIGMLGKSMGGLVAVIAAGIYKNIKSTALWSPAFHAEQWRELWEIVQKPETSDELRAEIMQFDGMHANEKFLREFFDIQLEEHLEHLHETPMLHIHGEKDEGLTIEHAEKYQQHREKAVAPTQIIRLPNMDHQFAPSDEQLYVLEETCQWFVKTL